MLIGAFVFLSMTLGFASVAYIIGDILLGGGGRG
jgi:hypothetical protein